MKVCVFWGPLQPLTFTLLPDWQNAKELQDPPTLHPPPPFAVGTIQHVLVQVSQVSVFLIKVRNVWEGVTKTKHFL